VKKIYTPYLIAAQHFHASTPDFIEDIGDAQKLFRPLDVSTTSEGTYMKIDQRLVTDFYISNIRMSDEFMIVPNLSGHAIIGATTMQKWRTKLDFEHDTVIINHKIAKAILKELKYSQISSQFFV